MNNILFTVTINGVEQDLSSYVTPFKFGNLLDEQLDELNMSLKYCPVENIPAMSFAVVTINQKSDKYTYTEAMYRYLCANSDRIDGEITATENGFTCAIGIYGSIDFISSEKAITITYRQEFVVASDNSTEIPNGSGFFSHEIYLIESTKIFEGFIGDSLTFTNTLGRDYLSNSGGANVSSKLVYLSTNIPQTYSYSGTLILTPSAKNISLNKFYDFVTAEDIDNPSIKAQHGEYVGNKNLSSLITGQFVLEKSITITDEAGNIIFGWAINHSNGKYYYLTYNNGSWVQGEEVITTLPETDYSYDIPDGLGVELSTKGKYNIEYAFYRGDSSVIINWNGSQEISTIAIDVVNITKIYPAKKWTIATVVDRLCKVLEPLKVVGSQEDSPYFKLADEQREGLDKIIAPEFTFTQQTFREQLQTVGHFIGAEPRYYNGKIYFEKYTTLKQSQLKNREQARVSKGNKTDINDYCTGLTSFSENLTSSLDYAKDITFMPSDGGYVSVRSEVGQLTDSNCFVPTYLPIYRITKLIANYGNKDYDITAFVYEWSDYSGILKSSVSVYPNSKAYAVYYTQGEENIYGLVYMNKQAVGVASYAICNILNKLGANISRDLTGVINIGFRIEYIPIFSARNNTYKQVTGTGLPRTLVYNQQSNLIETNYYGKHLQGVVERVGNIEKTYTYICALFTDIPKVGMLFNDEYYISAVHVEVKIEGYKCTVGLSKNFNRISEYVGINSISRMWEVSERQAVRRQSVFQDFFVYSMQKISDNPFNDTLWCYNDFFKNTIDLTCITVLSNSTVPSFAKIRSENANKVQFSIMSLPLTSTALGDTVVFTCEFQDNYSVGGKLKSEKQAWYTDYVKYVDLFGRVPYFDVALCYGAPYSEIDKNNFPEIFPLGTVVGNMVNINYLKDNREIPQFNFQLTAVCGNADGDDKLIIGDGWAKNNPLVTISPQVVEVWVLEDYLPRIGAKLPQDLAGAHKLSGSATYDKSTGKITLPPNTSGVTNILSWGLFVPQKETVEIVTDDNMEETTQTIYSGGELVIGGNGNIPEAIYCGVVRRNPHDIRYKN